MKHQLDLTYLSSLLVRRNIKRETLRIRRAAFFGFAAGVSLTSLIVLIVF